MGTLQLRLESGQVVLLDGATGTELEEAGLGERFRELNVRAVELAGAVRENAAEEPVYIAGSISTFPARLDHRYDPGEDEARANYAEQAGVLAEAGVDLLALEMMRDLDQTRYAMEAAVATELPVWVGFSCRRLEDGAVVLWDGRDTLAAALDVLPEGVSLVSIMHTLTEDVVSALREVLGRWDRPVGAYPHSGKFVMPNWQFTDMISAEDFASEAREWVGLGARVVGGCCGIGPEHIRRLRERLPPYLPSAE